MFITRHLTFSILLHLPFLGSAQALWEKQWLHQLADNRSTGKNQFYATVSDLNAPLTIGVPIGWIAIGLLDNNPLRTKEGMTWLAAQLVNGGATYFMKAVFNRPRPAVSDPTLVALEDVRIHSFPSGHTSSAFALATSLSLDHPKWFVIAPAYLYAALVGYSRCYLGVHYPSDVIAGAALGSASAWLTHALSDRLLEKSAKKKAKPKLAYTYIY